jgi:hypothetical protein
MNCLIDLPLIVGRVKNSYWLCIEMCKARGRPLIDSKKIIT